MVHHALFSNASRYGNAPETLYLFVCLFLFVFLVAPEYNGTMLLLFHVWFPFVRYYHIRQFVNIHCVPNERTGRVKLNSILP